MLIFKAHVKIFLCVPAKMNHNEYEAHEYFHRQQVDIF